MMDEEGLPLLIDFEFSSFDRSLHSGLTSVSTRGGFVGTLSYAAPESLDDSKHKPQRSGVEKEVPRFLPLFRLRLWFDRCSPIALALVALRQKLDAWCGGLHFA
jgi:hypothetical protein